MPANALVGIVAAALLVWVVYGPWQMICTDSARHRLFVLRDELFDLATDGFISFEAEEYKEARAMINALIRHAHKISIPRLLTVFIFSGIGKHPGESLFSQIECMEYEHAKNAMHDILNRCMKTVFFMVLIKSIPVFSISWGAVLLDKFFVMNLKSFYLRVRTKGDELVLTEALCSEPFVG